MAPNESDNFATKAATGKGDSIEQSAENTFPHPPAKDSSNVSTCLHIVCRYCTICEYLLAWGEGLYALEALYMILDSRQYIIGWSVRSLFDYMYSKEGIYHNV